MLIPQFFRRLTAAFGSIIRLHRQLQWVVVMFSNFGGPFESFCARISGGFTFRGGLLEDVSMHIFVIIVSTIVLYYRFIREFLLYIIRIDRDGAPWKSSHRFRFPGGGTCITIGRIFMCFWREARPKQMISRSTKWYNTALLFTKHRVAVFVVRIR